MSARTGCCTPQYCRILTPRSLSCAFVNLYPFCQMPFCAAGRAGCREAGALCADSFMQHGLASSLQLHTLTAALQDNEALQAELDAMRRAPSALAAARSKKAEHASDRQKFVQLNENLQVCAWAGQGLAQAVCTSPPGKRGVLLHSAISCSSNMSLFLGDWVFLSPLNRPWDCSATAKRLIIEAFFLTPRQP